MFVVSIFVNAFGIAFITKALLGTSPITSVTYVASMFTPLTMGQWTIIVNLLFVALELLFMTRKELKSDLRMYLLQIPISLCFGTFIDVSMNALSWLDPVAYMSRIGVLLIGCVILSVGIAFEVKADIAMMSGEYFVKAISRRLRKDFGYVKLGFDITLVVLACLLSIVFLSGIQGVREGTVVAALLVGPIVHFISPWYKCFDNWIGRGEKQPTATVAANTDGIIITIAREHGSSGKQIGKLVAQKLGIPFYYKEMVALAAHESGLDREFISDIHKNAPDAMRDLYLSSQVVQRAIAAQDRIIRRIADNGSCVIVGRAADYVLREHKNVVRVFVHAPLDYRIRRVMEVYGDTLRVAKRNIRHSDKARASYYRHISGRRWGDAENYELTVDSSAGLEETVAIIVAYACAAAGEK